MEACQISDTDVAERVAVIGALQRQVARFLWLRTGALPPVLKGHFDGHFDSGGAVIREKDSRQARR